MTVWGTKVFPLMCIAIFIAVFWQGFKHDSTLVVVVPFVGAICLGGWALGWVVKLWLDHFF